MNPQLVTFAPNIPQQLSLREVEGQLMSWHIYGLVDPRTGEIRYVGRTINPTQRLKGHRFESKRAINQNLPKSVWIKELAELNLKPILKILETGRDDLNTSERLWAIAERKWIAKLRQEGCNLLNRTNGGECSPPLAVSEDVRRKQSERFKAWVRTPEGSARLQRLIESGRKANTGRKPSKAAMEASRIALSGYRHSDDTKRKMAASRVGRKLTQEHVRKIAAANTGRKKCPHTPETKAKMSLAKKGKSLSPEHAAHISAAKKGTKYRPRRKAGLMQVWERGEK